MLAGKLDRRVTLSRATSSFDGLAHVACGWTEVATVSGSRQDLSGQKAEEGDQVRATITSRFQIRWSRKVADLNPKWRLACDGLTFEIATLKEIQRRRGWDIVATAIADQPADPSAT